MTLTIYYPFTSFTIGFLTISMFVYSILGLLVTGKDGNYLDSCHHLYGYYFVYLIVQGFYILSLITNRCCQRGVFRFLMTFIYYLSFVTIYTTTSSNITCIQQYYNSTNDDDSYGMFYTTGDMNTIVFYNMLQWNIIVSSICFNILLISFIYSQIVQFYSGLEKVKNSYDNDVRLSYPYSVLYK
jgi:hypothetical protein